MGLPAIHPGEGIVKLSDLMPLSAALAGSRLLMGGSGVGRFRLRSPQFRLT